MRLRTVWYVLDDCSTTTTYSADCEEFNTTIARSPLLDTGIELYLRVNPGGSQRLIRINSEAWHAYGIASARRVPESSD